MKVTKSLNLYGCFIQTIAKDIATLAPIIQHSIHTIEMRCRMYNTVFASNPIQPKICYSPYVSCNWDAMKSYLLTHWEKLSMKELDTIGPHRRTIAQLIDKKYGIATDLAENYLLNFERTLPLSYVMNK